MEESQPRVQKSQPSGLTALANLIQQKLPGYTRSKAFELIKLVRNENGGKLVGLKMKKFIRMSKVIASRDVAKNKEIRRVEQLERARLEATCPFCFRIFIEKFSCDRHVKNKHSKHLPKTVRKPAGKAVECLTCKKTFYNKTNLKRHENIHVENPPDFHCDICDKKFSRKDNLFQHRERVHKLFNINIDAMKPESQQSSFQCKMCSADFGPNQDALVNHILNKVCQKRGDFLEVNEEGRIECNICDKTYTEMNSLKKHIRSKHQPGNPSVSCDLCGKIYADMSSLTRHMNATHGSAKKENICEKCGVKFTRRHTLARHMRVLHQD